MKQKNRNRHGPEKKTYAGLVYREDFGYFILDGMISFLFFRSIAAWFILLPGFWFYRKEIRRRKRMKEKQMMRKEFLTGLQLAGTALQSGYSMENAFREALSELRKIYRDDSFIVTEFRAITVGIGLNESLEKLLLHLGEKSGVEEIRSFAKVFMIARRTGGDLDSIVRHTVSGLSQREETRLEIETVLSGKQMELKLMNGIPLFILGYVGLTSPGFLEPMYHNLPGILIMSICLVIYAAAWLWGARIMEITE